MFQEFTSSFEFITQASSSLHYIHIESTWTPHIASPPKEKNLVVYNAYHSMLKVFFLTNSKMFKTTFVKGDVKHRNVPVPYGLK
jgi:hypothetical protein